MSLSTTHIFFMFVGEEKVLCHMAWISRNLRLDIKPTLKEKRRGITVHACFM